MSSASSDAFELLGIENGLARQLDDAVRLAGFTDGRFELEDGATHFGLMTGGSVELCAAGGEHRLVGDGFFVLPRAARLVARDTRLLVISIAGYRGLAQIGGPLEREGRLRYIDGCSDTLLVGPPRLGEPCLNHLHIPAHTDQSPHVHDSRRVGIIVRGRGRCRTGGGSVPLEPGVGWHIPAELEHSFATGDEALDVLAWHPNSDFGPTDDRHPMINKTFLRQRR